MFIRLRKFARVMLADWLAWGRKEIELVDVLTVIGLAALGRGLWMLFPPAAWIVDGAVILWWALPQRPPFIERPKVKEGERRGT